MNNYSLSEKEVEAIQWGMHHAPQAEVRQRATGIHLLHLGKSPNEVSELLAVSLGSIYNWHRRWQAKGLEGLANKPKSGRPKNADEAYCDLLKEVLEEAPSRYGYGFGVWTVDRLREHLRQQTAIRLSNRRFRALMKALGYVYRRPKHDLTSLQEAEEKARTTELVNWLKKDVSQTSSGSSLWMKPR